MSLLPNAYAKAPSFLALSCVGSLLLPIAVSHASAQTTQDAPALGGVTVSDTALEIEVGRKQESPKATRPVRNTPQTVTIITKEVIDQQNLLTLRDMLSTVPGITFGAAEGGTPPSDQINLRGYSASNDITQDGVRDSAAYSRSDSFNLEQVEVVNGANSVTTGSGSVGGQINIVTKRPLADTRIVVSGGIGTDNYYRSTVDANVRVNDLIAVRLNAMAHENDVPGRDVENNKRWGIAPSMTIGIESPTRLTLQYVHQEDDNIPQYGVPYFTNATAAGPVPGVDRSDYFGFRNVDRQDITVDQGTAIGEHEFSDTVSIRNLGRWQKVSQLSVVGPPQGTYCLATGVQPTGAACPATVPAGYYLIGGPRGNYRDSENELMYDQFDLKAAFSTGAIEHTAVLGASASWEKYTLATGNALRNANRTLVFTAFPLVNIANPNQVVQGPAGFAYGSNVYTGPVNLIQNSGQHGEVTNYAVYLFDTLKLGKVELNGGVRWDSNHGRFRADTAGAAATLTTPQGAIVPGSPTRNDAEFFSYRGGLVYKPIEAVTLYASYGNSKTPSQSSVNGSCVATGTSQTCNTKPEGAETFEIGAKAELGAGVLLSAAVFRNERNSYRVDSGDPLIPSQQLDGHSRVDGVSLSAIGKITSAWQITANYTYLDGELIQSVSDKCLNAPGSTGCTNTVAIPDALHGAKLANTPKHSGSLFTTYALPFGLRLGYGATYQGSFPFATTNVNVLKSNAYWVHNAYVAYDVTPKMVVQVNVKNIADKDYYTRIRNNGWATPGDARAAVLSLNYTY